MGRSQPNEKYAIRITTSKKTWFASCNEDGVPDLYSYDDAVNIVKTLSSDSSEEIRNQQYSIEQLR